MNKELYQKYADLKNQLSKLEEEAEIVKVSIMEDMKEAEVEKVEAEYGSFTITSRKNWAYTDKVKGLETTLKATKKEEEEKGLATASITNSLLFKSK